MRDTLHRYSEAHRQDALGELEAELREFSHDGLVALHEDLTHGAVARGSWAGCVISYKRGAPGSARRDRLGRARNAFTVLWDNGWLTDEEVASRVEDELSRRVPAARAHSRSARPRPHALPATELGPPEGWPEAPAPAVCFPPAARWPRSRRWHGMAGSLGSLRPPPD